MNGDSKYFHPCRHWFGGEGASKSRDACSESLARREERWVVSRKVGGTGMLGTGPRSILVGQDDFDLPLVGSFQLFFRTGEKRNNTSDKLCTVSKPPPPA